MSSTSDCPDLVVIMTDQERAAPPYESDALAEWRRAALPGRRWFDEHGVSFRRHYTGSLACVPSRPTLFTGQYPDVHGVTQTDGLGKTADDSRMRWLRPGEVPTLGHWLRAAGYDTHYDGKWHLSHADLRDPDTGVPLATNDDDGSVDTDAVATYLAADPLDAYGFSGWVGPEPHGPLLANAGVRRDSLVADRVVAWLRDRYRRRREGDEAAMRPFLAVASFVNPHDIVFFPAWSNLGGPLEPSDHDPPPVPPGPTDGEDLSTKPASQSAYRDSYASAYGFGEATAAAYANEAQRYRDLYYRLHVEVDGPLDRVRRAVTDNAEGDTVLVRTSDHGELLGAHGGLHQKWLNLYDEATRVPLVIARVGASPTAPAVVVDMPTSHVDLVPTLLAAANVDVGAVEADLRQRFSEVHALPGRNLLPLVDVPTDLDPGRPVYLSTRDDILDGDTGASVLARTLGRVDPIPDDLRIATVDGVGTSIEGVVGRVDGRLWKLVRTFDDPATWSDPGRCHESRLGTAPVTRRAEALPDEWELYDLTNDPTEEHNLALDPDTAGTRAELQVLLETLSRVLVAERNVAWPYAPRGG